MNLVQRLYRGQTKFDFIGSRKIWYGISIALIVLSLGSMVFRGFNWGIEFSGGSSFTIPKAAGTSLEDAERAVTDSGVVVQTAQEAGSGGQTKYVLKTESLDVTETTEVKERLADELGIAANTINDSAVSSSWGSQVTRQALIALAVFLVVVSAYIWIRFEPKMAAAAILALLHDLVITAGIYSLVGFEVTPSTVVGLLTILGFSLYDTVVVFDKIEENAKGLLGGTRMTYGESANLAVNQTLMRSINTSLISLLPVAGLLFVGAGLLGVGTLKDLALVLFVGMAAGAYSSLFLATPWLVAMKEREPRYAALKQRVLSRRASAAKAESTVSMVKPSDSADDAEDTSERVSTAKATAGVGGSNRRRPSSGRSGGRPGGSKRRR